MSGLEIAGAVTSFIGLAAVCTELAPMLNDALKSQNRKTNFFWLVSKVYVQLAIYKAMERAVDEISQQTTDEDLRKAITTSQIIVKKLEPKVEALYKRYSAKTSEATAVGTLAASGDQSSMQQKRFSIPGITDTWNSVGNAFSWFLSDKRRTAALVATLQSHNQEMWLFMEVNLKNQALAMSPHSPQRRGMSRIAMGARQDVEVGDISNVTEDLASYPEFAACYRWAATTSRQHYMSIAAGYDYSSLKVPIRRLEMDEDYEDDTHRSGALLSIGEDHEAEEKQRRVFIEWREWHSENQRQNLPRLINRLCQVLNNPGKPQTSNVLDCVGYCVDPRGRRFGIIFNFPDSVAKQNMNTQEQELDTTLLSQGVGALDAAPEDVEPPSTELMPVSLKSEMNRNLAPPSREKKIDLALRISTGLYALHACGIFHKALRSNNILRFPGVTSSEKWFIAGFSVCREFDANSTHIQGSPEDLIYLPIEYLDVDRTLDLDKDAKFYKPSYDLYSLGLVLLEIGSWESLETKWAEWNCGDSASFHKNNAENIMELVGALAESIGEDYVLLIEWCLNAKNETWDDLTLLDVFDSMLGNLEESRLWLKRADAESTGRA